MYRFLKIIFILIFFEIYLFGYKGFISKTLANGITANPQWARSTISGTNNSVFDKTIVDTSGNIYAVGNIYGNSEYDFGNNVKVAGGYTTLPNALIVKYDSNGQAQWARSTSAGAQGMSDFEYVSLDTSGNIYAVGYIEKNGQFDFGNGVTVTGGNATLRNAVIVKYNSNGQAQWAKSTSSANSESIFYSITLDSSGNIYVTGYLKDNGQFDFGNGVTVTGASSTSNAVLVKYNSSGQAQWAKSTVAANNDSNFQGIDVDTSGNIYVVGSINGSSQFDFGNSVTVQGQHYDANVLIIKYNSSGQALWAKSDSTSANAQSAFGDVKVDASGNIYAVGVMYGNGQFGFGNSVTVNGGSNTRNAILVKYNSSGQAQWAKSTLANTPYTSDFNGVSLDSSGNVYTVGDIKADGATYGGNGISDFGNGVTITGAYNLLNAVIVKYNSSGQAQWAKSTAVAPNESYFYGVNVDASGNIYAVGYTNCNSEYDFGNNVSVTGGYNGSNALIIKYNEESNPTSTPNATPTPTPSGNGSDPNHPSGYKYVIHSGPNYHGTEGLHIVTGSQGNDIAKVLATNDVSVHDIYIQIDGLKIDYLIAHKLKVPWQQKLNVVGEIFNYKVLSAFNGYPILQLDKPVTIIVPYDQHKLSGKNPKNLRISYFDEKSKQWKLLQKNTVLDTKNHTLANTTKQITYFTVVYPQ